MPGGGRPGATTWSTSARSGWSPSTTQGRVVLVRQYRHPVGAYLWELPAGLIDVPASRWSRGRARELAEEADLRGRALGPAGRRAHHRPAAPTRLIRLFLARDLTPVPDGRPARARARGGRAGAALGRPGRGGGDGRCAARSPNGRLHGRPARRRPPPARRKARPRGLLVPLLSDLTATGPRLFRRARNADRPTMRDRSRSGTAAMCNRSRGGTGRYAQPA